jgi:hypothetical protein
MEEESSVDEVRRTRAQLRKRARGKGKVKL